jgi:hypothetical protein
MLSVKKESGWRFDTSESNGSSIGVVAAGNGAIYVTDPQGQAATLWYTAIGAGVGVGLPIKGKVQVAGSQAPKQLPNWGTVLIMDTFSGDELSRGDFTGPCAIVDIEAGFVVGGSATALLLGLSREGSGLDSLVDALLWVTPWTQPVAYYRYLSRDLGATALVLMAGANLSIGAGISSMVGYMW